MASMNLAQEIAKINIPKADDMLGMGLNVPFAASNSGSRKLMSGSQQQQRVTLSHPEVPFVSTGYEMEFGKHSSSYLQADRDLEVIGKIAKFSANPEHHYFVIAADHENGILQVFERKDYKHITENYGYLYNNSYLDSVKVGTKISEGTVVQKSKAFDEFDNRMDGINLRTVYTSCEETMEDAIIVSETAAKRLSNALVKSVKIMINDNDIPLNLYGDMETYKIFPDIGEECVNGILCGLRKEKKEEALYSQSYARLRELGISDERYTVAGKVVDINIYCNAPEKLPEYEYNAQLKYYYDDNYRMSSELVEVIAPYLEKGYKMDNNLHQLYSKCAGAITGKQYYSDRVFSNIVLEVVVIEEIPVKRGDKLCNRYGGKGVVSCVRPDDMMPKTIHGDTADIILNMCGVYGRENAGQLFEITVTYVCEKILQYINLNVLRVDECIDLYLQLLDIVAPSSKEYMEQLLSRMSDDDAIEFISGACAEEKCFYLAIEPMSENLTIDKVAELYDRFSWIKPEPMLMPILDSAGEIKYIPSRRPLIYGFQYIYRLKQYAEEKFSVTSLSATNIRNENSKSKSSNNYKALYSRTPIRFGDMETGNLTHLGAELVVQMLMLYSTSPHARRLTSEMLTGDAFNIDVKLDMDSKNRNAEILNVYLKTMGLKLTFKKIPKKLEPAMEIEPMYFFDDPHRLVEALIPLNKNEKFDMEAEVLRLLKEKNDGQWAMDIYPMEFTRLSKDEGFPENKED